MPPSHPPSVLTTAERTLREECGLRSGDGVLVAVSGGGDSMTLLHVMAVLSHRIGIRVLAHGIDHGLRPEAGGELDIAETLADRLEIAFARTSLGLEPGSNLQQRARIARYAALREAANRESVSHIATGHHADDRAETVILRLLRGSGPVGLGVLPPRQGDLVRPLIRLRRFQLRTYLDHHGIVFAEDPSNHNPRFLRTRVREELLPQFLELSPGVVEHLCCLADQLGVSDLGESSQRSVLGRRQRLLLERALARRTWGFELPLRGGGLLRLERATPRVQKLKE